MRRLPTVVWLTALWVILWRDVSVANIASGLAVGVLVEIAQPGERSRRYQHSVRPLALVSFVGWYAVKMFEANLVVAREVVTPANRIHTGVIEVELPPCSPLVFTIIANGVILTPGTLIIEARLREVPTVYVHVLHLHDVDAARADVEELARRVMAAFPRRDDPGSDR